MINISKRICVGWNNVSSDQLPSGIIAPLGKSTAEKKRLNTVKKYPNNKEYDNKPLPGFTIEDHGRKRYSTSTTTYNVIDPRGFKVEITSENLIDIVQISGITEGLIQDKCVWVRHDSRTGMILLPIISEDYKEAVQNTELLDNKVKISAVQIGDTVITQGGQTGTFMGTLSLYGPLAEGTGSLRDVYQPQSFLRRQVIKIDDWYYYATDTKILSVIDKTDKPMTKEESAKLINKDLIVGQTYFTSTPNGANIITKQYWSTHGMISYVSPRAERPTISFVEIDKPEFDILYHRGHKCDDISLLLGEKANGSKFIIDYDSRNSRYSNTSGQTGRLSSPTDNFSCTAVAVVDNSISLINGRGNYWYNHNRPVPSKNEDFTTFKKFYKIVKHIKDESYV